MVWIKTITLQGFKSFGNKRTVIKLPRGLVVITGPNGGGKSTVLDAVKFALGELSAHNLRVDRFSKLLHESSKGADSQAYVTLTLDNTDRSLPVDSDEVVIGRRLYATGESEYILNGRTVSRNEMLTILAAANIKPDGLNLVTQGSVVGIAEMTSKEVREVLEDAAGISGYKRRRDEAFKELETAQKNIDIAKAATSEVRSRVKQLEVERNQLLRKTLLEKTINTLKSAALLDETKSLKKSLEDIENKALEILTKISEQQGRAEAIRSQLTEAKKDAEQLGQTLEELSEQIRETERQLFNLESEKTRKQAEKNSVEQSLYRSQSTRRLLTERISRWRQRMSEINEVKKVKEAEADKARSEWAAAEKELASLRQEAESIRRMLDEAENRYSAKLEELRFLRLSDDGRSLLLDNIEKQLAKKRSEKSDAEKQLEENRERQAAMTRFLEELNRELQDFSDKLTYLNSEKEHLSKTAAERRAKLSNLDEALEQAKLLKNSVTQLLEATRAGKTDGATQKPFKTVGELFAGDIAGWQAAVLGDWVNAVVVENFDAALSLATQAAEKKIRLKIVSELDSLDELVRTLAYGTPPKPIESAKKITSTTRNTASEDGVYVGPSKIINVSPEPNEKIIIQRIEKNLEKISTIENRLMKAREMIGLRLEETEEKFGKIEAELERLRNHMQAKSLEKIRTETELANVSKAVELLKRRLSSLDEEVSKLESERERLTRLVAEKSDELSVLPVLKKEVETKRDEIKRIDTRIRDKSFQVSELYRAFVNLERAKDALEVELKNLSESMADAEEELAATAEHDVKLARQVEEISQSIAEIDAKIKDVRDRRNELENLKTTVSTKLGERSAVVKQLEQSLASVTSELSALEKEHNSLAIERVRLETSLKSLNERLQVFGAVEEDVLFSADLLQPLEKEFAEIPVVNQLAVMQYDGIIENYRLRSARINELEMERKRILDLIESVNREEAEAFQRALERVSDSFSFYFNQLTNGEGFLRLENPAEPLNSGVEMVVKFLGKQARSTVSISGGEKSVSAVALILSLQDLTPAQFYVFDEIDAHLDVVYVKNLVNLLKKMSSKKQIIIITLKDIIAEQADALFGVYMVNESSQVVKTSLSEVVEVGK
ncbi:MAG: chromosome segregation SMC family protein [Candidatus Caldarchaeum sp.]|nr:chromosome segregation SMC family protein [Candidatus Caldarchaeum sp.]